MGTHSADTLPGAMPAPQDEAKRRRALRNHRAFASGLLVLAALIFLACSYWQAQGTAPGWVGYARAGAEAGMIGGIADWFAVTALFRHPLGIPIPHTALLPKKKDQLGTALSGFVGDNFLNAHLITEKVASANIPQRVGGWLAQPENAALVSREAGKLTANAVRAIDATEAEALIRTQLIDKAAEPLWGPPAGRILSQLIEDGKTEPVVDAVIGWARTRIYGMEGTVVTLIDDRMPTWAPKFAKSLVGERVYKEIVSFIEDVDANPDHEARHALRRFIAQLAEDLQHDEVMIARVESLKADIMGSAAVQGAAADIWAAFSRNLIAAASAEDSVLRTKAAELCLTWGTRIQEDPELRASLDRRLTGIVSFLADNYSGEVTSIISETVERWDAEEASDKIELMVGKDLQYIRVNGTLVGALVGVVIYTVSQVLF
ncbi:MAG TPA: DUF445 family protein, partial [Corynebacterium sp.]|nr:DUF445 family protein [Corynebacterium sp.]